MQHNVRMGFLFFPLKRLYSLYMYVRIKLLLFLKIIFITTLLLIWLHFEICGIVLISILITHVYNEIRHCSRLGL